MPVKLFIGRRPSFSCRAFSISEVVVAMAIIVMLSVLGFFACNVGLQLENAANRLFYLSSGAENVRSAFEKTLCETGGVSQSEERKKQFILTFNIRLAFALDSYAPDMHGLSENAGFGAGQAWNIRIVNKSRTEWVSETDENGMPQIYERTVPIEGLDIDYDGSAARFVFQYRYYTALYELLIEVNMLHGNWLLTVNGYGAGALHPSYEWGKIYE